MIDKVLSDHGVYGSSKVKRHYTQIGLTKPATRYLFLGAMASPVIKIGDDKLLAGKRLIQYNKYDSDYFSLKWDITNSESVIDSIVVGDFGYLICLNTSRRVDLKKINMDTGEEVKSFYIGTNGTNSSDYSHYDTRVANDKYGNLYVTKGRYGGTVKLNQELEELFEIPRAQSGFQDDYLTVYDEYVVRVFHYSTETVIYNLEGEELSRKNLGANFGYSNVIFDESLDSFYMLNNMYMSKWSFNEGLIGDKLWTCHQKEFKNPIFLDNFKETMLARDNAHTYNTFHEADKATGLYLGYFSYPYEMSSFLYDEGYITSRQFESMSLAVDHPFFIET